MHHPAVPLSASRPAEKGLSLCVCVCVEWFGGCGVHGTLLPIDQEVLSLSNAQYQQRQSSQERGQSLKNTHTQSLSQSYEEAYPKETHAYTRTNTADLPKNTGASAFVWQPNENDVLFLFGAC